jgi:hypothetical protein
MVSYVTKYTAHCGTSRTIVAPVPGCRVQDAGIGGSGFWKGGLGFRVEGKGSEV